MDTAEKLKNWLHLMGYNGEIPTNLKPICNPCTSIVWEQLIQKVKPRENVERIRNTIIMNYFNKSSRDELELTKHSIREINLWEKKRSLENQIAFAKEQIRDAKSKSDDLYKVNQMKYLNIENVKKRILKQQKVTFLLKAKYELLSAELVKVQDMLNLSCSLTPNESEECQEVLDTLKKCTEKLEKLIKDDHQKQVNEVFQSAMYTPKNRFKSTITKRNKKCISVELDESFGLLNDYSLSFNDALAASSFKEALNCGGILNDQTIFNDKALYALINNLCRSFRGHVWNALCNDSERQKTTLIKTIVSSKENFRNESNTNETHFIPLYAKHIDYNLKMIKVNLNMRILKNNNLKLQNDLFEIVENYPHPQLTQIKIAIRLKQREVGLLGGIKFLQQMKMQEIDRNKSILQATNKQIQQLNEQISATLRNLEQKYVIFQQIYDAIEQMRSNTLILVRKLGKFTENVDWTKPLMDSVAVEEISTFLDFPLDYNASVVINNKIIKRNNLLNNYLCGVDLDSNTLLILTTLLASPWNPPETLLIKIVEAKEKLNVLKSLMYTSTRGPPKYTYDNLVHQNSYLNYALNKLETMIYSDSNKTLQKLVQLKETVNLWLEMPFKEFVSEKKLFNMNNYHHYQQQYEKFYQQL
ncbi:hypothetical protein FQA39_LY10030 [Lamprigera yunnana]|nr:hypothetical protein FQA39_LY10030 [Lamprigera yunnana]